MTRRPTIGWSVGSLFWIVCVLSVPGTSLALTLTVCPSGCTTTTIQAAITAATSGDTVRIESAMPHTEFGVIIDRNLTIEGLGELQTIVQAGAAPQIAPGRVFTVEPGRDVTIRDMTIRYGNEVAADGGGLWIRSNGNPSTTARLERVTIRENFAREGGGIANDGDLTLTDVVIRENEAFLNGGGLRCILRTTATQDVEIVSNTADRDGGGIYKGETDGLINLHGVLIESNRAEGLGGGIFDGGMLALDTNSSLRLNEASHGAGLFQSTTGAATIRNSAIAENEAFDSILTFGEFGGGLHIRGALDMRDSLVQANQVATLGSGNGRGGGIYIGAGADVTMKRMGILQNTADEGGGIYLSGATSGSYLLESSAVTQNLADASGGGIFHFSGDAVLINVTIGSNAAFGSGGGLFAREGNLDLAHVTVAENLGDVNANGDDGGGVSFCTNCTPDVRLFSSIVADNRVGGTSLYPDCDVTFASGSYSLIGVTGPGGSSSCSVGGITAGMLFDTSPDFDASVGVDYAIVHPLLAGSPAIDSGSCDDGIGGSILIDQRGASVPVDGDGDLVAECDMGAYEYLPEPGLAGGLVLGFGCLLGLRGRGRGWATDARPTPE